MIEDQVDICAAALTAFGVSAWTVDVLSGEAALVLPSASIAEWNDMYVAAGYGVDDPVLRYGRGCGPLAQIDRLTSADGSTAALDVAQARRTHGLIGGLVYPDGRGGFSTFYGLPPEVEADPGHGTVRRAVTTLRRIALFGDFTRPEARRYNRHGRRLPERMAEICRLRLAGLSVSEVAEKLGVSESAVRKALESVTRHLGKIGVDVSVGAAPAKAWELGLFDRL